MAFISTKSNIKNSILAFIKHLVSKTVYRAIEVILTPCCSLSGSAVVECIEDSSTLTITTNESIGFLGKGSVLVNIDGTSVPGSITEPDTITVSGLTVPAGTYNLNIVVFLPTSSIGSSGVYKAFTINNVTFGDCPPVVSDIRLKENVELVGKSPSGLNIYNFSYIGEKGTYQGVMAQDLLGTPFESAVVKGTTGSEFMRVDYSKLDVQFKKVD